MATLFLRRAGLSVFSLLLVSLVLFVLTRSIPDSPARIVLGDEATAGQIAQFDADHGLGEPFEFGVLKRPKKDRLREAEARVLALKIAAQYPDKTATTEDIKKAVPSYTELSALDLVQSKTRTREKLWQQIVGNVISHKGSPSGLFINGYARRTPDGLSVTEKGMAYLNSLGFFGSSAALAE